MFRLAALETGHFCEPHLPKLENDDAVGTRPTVEELLAEIASLKEENRKIVDYWRGEVLLCLEAKDVVDQAFRKTNLLKSLEGNDKLTRFHTGLHTSTLFESTFKFVSGQQKEDPRSALCLKGQFLLTLMKLRLNLKEEDLAFRFGISSSSVSRTPDTFKNG